MKLYDFCYDSPYNNIEVFECSQCDRMTMDETITSLLDNEKQFCCQNCLDQYEDNYNCNECHACNRMQFVQECYEYDNKQFCSDECMDTCWKYSSP